jgi:hypothetical protein
MGKTTKPKHLGEPEKHTLHATDSPDCSAPQDRDVAVSEYAHENMGYRSEAPLP